MPLAAARRCTELPSWAEIPHKVSPGRTTDFGALRRRRRRGVLAILAALTLAACLAWAATALLGTDNAESSVPRVTETAGEPPDAPKATPAQGGPRLEEETTIPDVSGRSLEEAVKTISGAGFEVAAIETETNRRAPETAIRTNPPAGAPAKPGAPVTLTMSAGPPRLQQALRAPVPPRVRLPLRLPPPAPPPDTQTESGSRKTQKAVQQHPPPQFAHPTTTHNKLKCR
jgi:hypothetical protein